MPQEKECGSGGFRVCFGCKMPQLAFRAPQAVLRFPEAGQTQGKAPHASHRLVSQSAFGTLLRVRWGLRCFNRFSV